MMKILFVQSGLVSQKIIIAARKIDRANMLGVGWGWGRNMIPSAQSTIFYNL